MIVKTFFGGFFCLLFHINRYLDDSVIQEGRSHISQIWDVHKLDVFRENRLWSDYEGVFFLESYQIMEVKAQLLMSYMLLGALSLDPLQNPHFVFFLLIFPSEASPSPVKSSPDTSPMTSPRQRRDSDRYCQLCNAWFNNPGMAQQHYDGKKHKKNAARADLLEQLGKTLDMGEMKGTDAAADI